MGVADIPVIRAAYTSSYVVGNGYSTSLHRSSGLGAAVGNDEILKAVSEAQIAAMSSQMGESHNVDRLGYKGKMTGHGFRAVAKHRDDRRHHARSNGRGDKGRESDSAQHGNR